MVLWAFPLYVMVVCSRYKRFIELIFERKAEDAFPGTYAASLSTSIHFFDQTAHAYIHAISDDLGMKYLGFYSADIKDLLIRGGTDTPREIYLPPPYRSTRKDARSSGRRPACLAPSRMLRVKNKKPFAPVQKRLSSSLMTRAVHPTLRQ